MKQGLFGKSTVLALTVTLIFGVAVTAEAQRRQSMMERPDSQAFDDRWGDRRMDGPPGAMGSGMGMMGPGPGMMGGGGMPCPIMNRMGHPMGMTAPLNLPGLTEEQQREIARLQREIRRRNMENWIDIMDIRDDILIEMTAERPDPEKIRELHARMGRKQGEMLEAVVENRNRIYDLLTQAQQEQVREYQRRPFDYPRERQGNW